MASTLGADASAVIRLHAAQLGAGASLELAGRGPVACEHGIDDGSLWLRCDAPIDVADPARIAAVLSDWLTDVRYGYDSLLLVPRGAVEFRVARRDAETVVVELQRAAPARSRTDEPEAGTRPRKERISALIALERGDPLRARQQLRALADTFPNDVDVLLELANVETRMGRWRQALALYNRVLALSPGSAQAARAKAALLRRYGPRVSVSADWQEVEDADRQWIWQLDGRTDVGPESQGLLNVELRHVDDAAIKRASGIVEPFSGLRQRGSAGILVDHAIDASSELDILWGPNGVGVAVRHETRGNWGVTSYRGELNRAYWDLVEGLADEGSVSRIAIEHRFPIRSKWGIDMAGGWSQYGSDGERNAARAWGAAFGVQRSLDLGATTAGVAYRFDTERVYDRAQRMDPAGEPFAPLPLPSRELHVLEVAWNGLVTDYVEAALSGGYSIDRLNSQGPFADAVLKWEPASGVEIGLRVNHSIAALRGTGQSVTRIGAYAQLQL